ncbi:hypothetical protein [Parasedimentitalea psychrophila]|uniref:Uncharacterized protein n=1 Tax=Parasedimentitalea psychrophila TaxID=2997337 RepID=A0A9Y2L5F2_9RHOB|nr:hypothetical protein [Parasedimentitalea psychrophila]WIY27259.1 hypothetical protein QPJ95_10245 [Parasedimentitalea psychrophila]
MTELHAPNYRVRLFLSVDLTGSTAFKSKNTSFEWLKAFQHFYGEFPRLYSSEFDEVCSSIEGIGGNERSAPPKIWKTIGDEILFVNRVLSITHLGAYVTAFSKSLHKFGELVQAYDGLNTKGNGWIAAFPSPNCSIGIGDGGDADPMSGGNELSTEEFESIVDEEPKKFDFLGKGIDGGFRISRNSTVNTFTISPALAFLLTKAKTNPDATKFDADFRFHETQSFKGVVNGRPYPIISIDTIRDEEERELHRLEAKLLQRPSVVADCVELKDYLDKYIKLNKIEKPVLKLTHGVEDQVPPEHYQSYVKEWEAERKKSKGDDASFNEDGNPDLDSIIPSVEEAVGGIVNDH